MLLLVLVALAPPTVIALIVALEERTEARDHAQADVLDSTRLAAADVEAAVDGTAAFVKAVAHELEIRPGVRHCRRLLALVPQATDRYRSVGVARPDGRVYCGATEDRAARSSDELDASGASWFRRAQRGRGFVLGDFGVGPASDTKVIIGAHPVRRGPGERRAVLFAALRVRRLTEGTALANAPRGFAFAILDDRGTVLARRPAIERLVGKRLPERPLVETVLRERQGTAEVKGLDGVRRIHGFAPVGGNADDRLFVTAGRSSESVFADPNHDLRRYLILAGLGLVTALGLSYLASKVLLGRWARGGGGRGTPLRGG